MGALLAGTTTRGRATAQALGGLPAGVVALWAVTALILVVAGRSSRVGIGTSGRPVLRPGPGGRGPVFTAVGALTSQLAATRRQAAGYAGAFLGVSYALRLVADSGTGLHWLVWCTPLGLDRGTRAAHLAPVAAPRAGGRLHGRRRCR